MSSDFSLLRDLHLLGSEVGYSTHRIILSGISSAPTLHLGFGGGLPFGKLGVRPSVS
jgi:hypothetical protein